MKKGRNFLIILLTTMIILASLPQKISQSAKAETVPTQEPNTEIKVKANERSELNNKRTANSKTFINPDGTLTTEISQTPIHFKDTNNNWEPINNNLVTNAPENVYQNKSNNMKVKFNEKQELDTSILEIEEKNISIKMELQPLEHTNQKPAAVKGLVKENNISYEEVYPNIDLNYSVGSDRIKEDIVYKMKPVNGFPEKFIYKMDLEGMYIQEKDGILYLYDQTSKQPIYYFDAPYMYDSFKPEGYKSVEELDSIPEEAISYDVDLDYEVKGNQLYLNLYPNKEWLNDSKRDYPITIDPTIVRLQSSTYVEDTNIRSGFLTQTGGNDLELGAGTASGNTIRSLLKFDLSSIPGSEILDASLNLWFSSTNSSLPLDVSLHRMTRTWAENEASWNYAKTVPSTSWTSKGGDFISAPSATVTGLTSPGTLDNSLKKWDVPASVVQGWISNQSTNYGILLKSTSEATINYKKFVSSESTLNSKYHPLLVVTYKSASRLGLEGYWLYDSHPLVGGTSYSNLGTGNNVIQYQDLVLPSRGGFDFTFTRTYNSKSVEKSAMGQGWTYTGNEKLFINGDTIIYSDQDGTDVTFTYNSSTLLYESGPGNYLTIKQSTTDTTLYTLEDKYGIKTNFKVTQTSPDTNMKVATIQTKVDRHGNQITFEYVNNRLEKIKSDLGGIIKSIIFTYNAAGYIESATYDGNSFTYHYDSYGRMDYVDQLKNIGITTRTEFKFDANGRINEIKDPNGRKTNYTYQNEFLIKVQDPQTIDIVDDPPTRPGITYKVDTVNKIATVTQPEGTVTTYYTNDNYVMTRKIESGIETNYVLDYNYNPEMITKNGKITHNNYDLNGNLLSTTDPEDHTQTYTYTTNYSNVASYEDSNHNITRYTYKTNGDLATITFPDTGKETYVFDSYGDLESVTHPDGTVEKTKINYSSGQIEQRITDPINLKDSITVTDTNGNIIEKVDRKNNKNSFYYNKKNELESVKDPNLKETKYAYDNNGNLTSITNAKNKTWTFKYNGQNQLIEEIDPLFAQLIALDPKKKGITYQYDDNGNLTETTLLNGHSIINQYDNDKNQLTSESVKINNVTTTVWGYGYDNNSRISRVCKEVTPCDSDTNAQKVFRYNDDDSLDTVTDRGNHIDYNDLGSQQQTIYTVGTKRPTLDYFLNNMNQLKEIKRTIDTTTTTLATFHYEIGGLPKTVTYQNGSSMQMSYIKNRLNTFKVYNKTSTELDTYTLGYDANQNINQITSNTGVTDYLFDALNQLTQEKLPDGTTINYGYDDVGNRTSKSGATIGNKVNIYNDLNQLVKIQENNQDIANFAYDLNGNLIDDGSRTYEFNDFNQLMRITDKNSTQTIASYTYDEEGKRISSTTSLGTINFFYDGDNVLYETDGNNNVLREYTYNGNGIPLTMTMNGNLYYYLFNHHGDIIGLTDSAGNVVASYTYDAWGNILTQTGAMASVNPYRYAGYRYEENTKLYYLMARYYNPDNGVFLSIDPVRGEMMNPITQNGYNYANNNPVMMVDPDGTYAMRGSLHVFGGLLAAMAVLRAELAKLTSKAFESIKDKFKRKFYLTASYRRHIRNNHILPWAEGKNKSKFDKDWSQNFIYSTAEKIANNKLLSLHLDFDYYNSDRFYKLAPVIKGNTAILMKVTVNISTFEITSAYPVFSISF
jgi:RHS repeat-associated protein